MTSELHLVVRMKEQKYTLNFNDFNYFHNNLVILVSVLKNFMAS